MEPHAIESIIASAEFFRNPWLRRQAVIMRRHTTIDFNDRVFDRFTLSGFDMQDPAVHPIKLGRTIGRRIGNDKLRCMPDLWRVQTHCAKQQKRSGLPEPAPEPTTHDEIIDLDQHEQADEQRPVAPAGESDFEWKYCRVDSAGLGMFCRDDANEIPLFLKCVRHRIDIRFLHGSLVEHRDRLEILKSLNMLHLGETAFSGDIPDDTELDRHHTQRIVHVLHNEDAFTCGRQVFAELLVATDARLVNLEVGTQIINFDDTDVIFFDYAPMCECSVW